MRAYTHEMYGYVSFVFVHTRMKCLLVCYKFLCKNQNSPAVKKAEMQALAKTQIKHKN